MELNKEDFVATIEYHATNQVLTFHTDTFTQKPFDTQKLRHTDPIYKQTLLHTNAFTHTLPLSHRNTFYTETLLHTHHFTQRRFNTQILLHTDTFTQKPFDTQTLLHTDAFTQRRFYTTEAFTTHRCFYTQKL